MATPDYMRNLLGTYDPTKLPTSTFNNQQVVNWASVLRPGDTSDQYTYVQGYDPVKQEWAKPATTTNAMTTPPAPTSIAAPPSMIAGQAQPSTTQPAPAPAPPLSPWQTQPKPTAPPRQTMLGGGVASQTAGSGGLPAGFNLRTGSTDPTDPTGQNRMVYGDNYFPGGLPGFEGITNAAQFGALNPDQQGSYREALYLWNQRRQGLGAQPGQLPIPGLPGDPYGVQEPGSNNTVGPGGVWQGGGAPPTPPPGGSPPPGGGAPPPGNAPPGGEGTRGMDYPGGRGNYMGYGPNAGGLRLDPNYLPETWDYKESPEYLNRLKWAQRDLNRQLLSMGRSDSTGGINAMARQQSEMAGQEIDKQYQRALQANMENYGRYFGANQANYGRTVGEDQTGWNRAAYLGEQDWLHNWQLANLGFDATKVGVGSGNQTGQALAELLNQNGATQASLALRSGAIGADTIQALLNAGLTYAQINSLFSRGGSTSGTAGGGGGTTTSGGGGEAGDLWG